MVAATWIAADADADAGKRRVSQIRQLARGFLPCRVVDLGAGSCEISLRLKQDWAEVVAVDWTAERILSVAKDFFIQGDAVEFDSSWFDLIVCAGLLYHLSIEQQETLAEKWRSQPVILDTHFSRLPDVNAGQYSGQYRNPSWSTKIGKPFVHTVPSLRKLFTHHRVIETFSRTTPDRQTMLLIPIP
jgi:SAM-dependent methyltransferase